MYQERFRQKYGIEPVLHSFGYADIFLRQPTKKFPLPDFKLYNHKGLWLPLSCTITRVQTAYKALDGAAPGLFLSTASITTTTGNLVVVIMRSSGSTSFVANDNTNSYVMAIETTVQDPYLALWYAKNITGTTHSIDGVWNTNPNYGWVYAIEYSGVDQTSPLMDSDFGASVSTTDLTAGAITTTDAGVVVLGGSQNNFATYSAGTDFTLIDGSINGGGSSYGGVEEYITSGSLSGYTSHLTSSATDQYQVIVAAFKAAASGATFRRLAIQGVG